MRGGNGRGGGAGGGGGGGGGAAVPRGGNLPSSPWRPPWLDMACLPVGLLAWTQRSAARGLNHHLLEWFRELTQIRELGCSGSLVALFSAIVWVVLAFKMAVS